MPPVFAICVTQRTFDRLRCGKGALPYAGGHFPQGAQSMGPMRPDRRACRQIAQEKSHYLISRHTNFNPRVKNLVHFERWC